MTAPGGPGSMPSGRMPGTDWILAMSLVVLTLGTRWPYRLRLLPTWDAIQFALALGEYDVVRHQPHPPGYILYVAMGRLAGRAFGDPTTTLTALAVVASALAVFLLYRLGWQFYGRGTATLAALGLAVSPLFWAYSVVGLPYCAEAALATGIALGAWGTRQGLLPALLGSAILLGLAGGVRQSMLVTLGPLWLGAAWLGFRKPGPVLGGLAVIALVTAGWLAPMLWLTGTERYVEAGLELYASTVHATTLFGGGVVRNLTGLSEASLVGVGVFLPILAWGGWQGLVGLWRADARAQLVALWTLPALAVYGLVHLGQHGYLLTILPACYLVVGRTLTRLGHWSREVSGTLTRRQVLAASLVGGALGAHALFFLTAGPVDVPQVARDAPWWEQRRAEARALYRFRLWAHTATGLREQEAVIDAYTAAIRRQFDPRDTVLLTELGNPRSYPWFRHLTYYLPEYAVYHLRLGEPRLGYLASRDLTTMVAVAERRVLLPPATRWLVWVVDEWHPGLPRPPALEARPIAYGRSVYVLKVRRRVVEHAGYRLVPPTTVARLP